MQDTNDQAIADAEAQPYQVAISTTAFVQAFLAAACDGSAGAALYALMSSDAAMYRLGRWQAKEREALAAFATHHRQLHALGSQALPAFVAAQAVSSKLDSTGEFCVIWFVAREAQSASPVLGALGVRTADTWRVSWATLADRQHDWSFADGLTQTLANFSWMELRDPAIARTTLDASYFRLHWLPEVALTSLTGARFTCRQSSTCCRQDYEIAIPAAAQSLIDALPWERLAPHLRGTQLRTRGENMVEIKDRNEACQFLGSRNECLIHAELGYQPFGPCAAFPFSFATTPDGVDVTASLTCGSVCEAIGAPLADRDKDLRQRIAIAPVRSTGVYRLAFDKEVSWPIFRNTESLLLELIESEELPLHRRLHLGVGALTTLLAGEEIRIETLLEATPIEINADLRQQIGGLLDNIMAWDRIASQDLKRTVPRDLRHNDLRNSLRLVAILRALHFSKIYSYEYDLVTAHNLAIVVYLLALSWQRDIGGNLDDLRWRELAMLGSHGLLKSLLPAEAPRAYRELLGSPQFGEWALAFAAW